MNASPARTMIRDRMMKDALAKIREHNTRINIILRDLPERPLPYYLRLLHKESEFLEEAICTAMKLSVFELERKQNET